MFIRGHAQFGEIAQSAMAFTQLLGAFSLIVTQFQSISSFTAIVGRLGSFAEAIESRRNRSASRARAVCDEHTGPECSICPPEMSPLGSMAIRYDDDSGIMFDKLTLRSPRREHAGTELTVTIPHGMRVLVTGQNQV